ncbi:MAG: CoA pyrophosphatase [Atopobiaceae bacterium]|nr:CoA pyrophosphatase [Atopobiaceae bacterium]
MQFEQIENRLRAHHANGNMPREAAVLIPLFEGPSGIEVLLEVRAKSLSVQPGEVCLPGGGIEHGETPREAAVRETCEELLVSPTQIEVLGSMGAESGPGGMPLHVFVGKLSGYEGGFSADEVDHTFSLSLCWLMSHEPQLYDVRMQPSYPANFPWELVPGGREYSWRTPSSTVPFYAETHPVVWGATARVLWRFIGILRG